MQSNKIEDYALIGDCETAALVHRNGSVDWLCWPDFSSPACFAALLGSRENGYWQIAPRDPHAIFTRRYRPHTLILETTMETPHGSVLVTDFMPIRGRHSDLVRIVQCTAGTVNMRFELCLRFDYGSTIPWIHFEAATRGESAWVSEGWTKPDRSAHCIAGQGIGAGHPFGGVHHECRRGAEIRPDLRLLVRGTSRPHRGRSWHCSKPSTFGLNWLSRNKYQGPYRAAVERSLITLKAMTYRPSGGIVAAPTTSLPERIGGPLNWDYRYCWIRDATLYPRPHSGVRIHGRGDCVEAVALARSGTKRFPGPDHVRNRRRTPHRRLGGAVAIRL